MNVSELEPALRKLRLSGMAEHLELRLLEARQSECAPIDLISALVQDELSRRQDRLLSRRIGQAGFRDAGRTLASFDFKFNAKIDRALVFELATARFLERAEDAVFLGPPGTGKSHLAQAIGLAAIHQGHRVVYREVHVLLEEIADAALDGTRKEYLAEMASVPLLILDDLGMRKLPPHRGRGSARADHPPLRTRQHAGHLEPPRRRLGPPPRRHRRRHGHARSTPAPRPSAQMRAPELADEKEHRLAEGRPGEVRTIRPGLAVGRLSDVHRGSMPFFFVRRTNAFM